MKILLAYSKTFFCIGKGSRYKNASAGINAKILYEILCQYGEVDYIDTSEFYKVKKRKYDVFIGINANYNEIMNLIQCKKCIYYAVTQHPAVFTKKLLLFRARKKIYVPDENIYNILKETGIEKIINIKWREELKMKVPDLNRVDHIIVIGNKVTADSFYQIGVEKKELTIYPMN